MRMVKIALCALILKVGAAPLAEAQNVRLVSRSAVGISASADNHSFLGAGLGNPNTLGLRRVSADGRFVVFTSLADNLVPGELNTHPFANVYRTDRVTETTLLVSHKDGSPAVSANAPATSPLVSADGCVVAFESSATDLQPGAPAPVTSLLQIFLYDCKTGDVSLATHAAGSPTTLSNGNSALADLSADGRVVLFTSGADNLSPAGNVLGIQVYAYDRQVGASQLVTRTAASATTSPNDQGGFARLSADGRFVGFASFASDVIAGFSSPNGRHLNVFVQELATGITQLVSHQAGSTSVAQDNDAGVNLSLSADGRFVAFESSAMNLVAGQVDTLGSSDIFLFDGFSGASILVSRAAGTPTVAASRASFRPLVSANGLVVVFESSADDLLAGYSHGGLPTSRDVFLFDRGAAANVLVSHSAATLLVGGDGESFGATLSDDGDRVLYRSYATNLVTGQIRGTGSALDAFLYDRAAGSSRLVSHASTSALRTGQGILSGESAVSGDGRFAAFASYADDLVATDVNDGADVFLYGPAAPLALHTVLPCRAADTRAAEGPKVAAGTVRNFVLRGKCEVPMTAEAVAVNLTALSPTAPGFLTLFAAGQIPPPSSNTNFAPGLIRANNAILTPGVGGRVSVLAGMASGQLDLLIDVVGYFE